MIGLASLLVIAPPFIGSFLGNCLPFGWTEGLSPSIPSLLSSRHRRLVSVVLYRLFNRSASGDVRDVFCSLVWITRSFWCGHTTKVRTSIGDSTGPKFKLTHHQTVAGEYHGKASGRVRETGRDHTWTTAPGPCADQGVGGRKAIMYRDLIDRFRACGAQVEDQPVQRDGGFLPIRTDRDGVLFIVAIRTGLSAGIHQHTLACIDVPGIDGEFLCKCPR